MAASPVRHQAWTSPANGTTREALKLTSRSMDQWQRRILGTENSSDSRIESLRNVGQGSSLCVAYLHASEFR
jgi:hypothetical protein